MAPGWCTKNEARHCSEAKIKARGNESYGQPNPHHLCPHQIMGSRVTEVWYQLLCWCHQGLIDLEVPGICTMANDTAGSLEAI